MKKTFLFLLLIILVALILPVANLVVGLPKGVSLGSGEGAPEDFALAAAALSAKCTNCHAGSGQAAPFYASLPVASNLIKADIEKGTEWLDLVAAFAGAPKEAVNEAVLAKIEARIQDGTMPPKRYLALHWDGGLTPEEQSAVVDWIGKVRSASFSSPGTPENLKTAVIQPIPSPPKLDAEKVALGARLYHDGRLSGDNSISCASCHDLGKGGTDQEPVSTGVGGKKGGINAPTVFNAAFNLAQFWDGRAADLAAQAAGPPENPIEMAATFAEIVKKLNDDAAFKAEFEAAYPKGISKETICDAIAIFEKTLLTPNSDFDKFLKGDEKILGDDARQGHALFVESGCATCHVGTAMGGQSYEKMGRYGDYFADRGNPTDADIGRAAVTKDEVDKGKFKVPTLRNIALTAPYFHDAYAKTLEEAVKHMGTYQSGIEFSEQEVGQLVAFLESLTGELNGKKL